MFKKKGLACLLTLCLLIISLFAMAPMAMAKSDNHLTIATTTSLNDTGLLKKLVPIFEKKYHAQVDVIAVGTGQALEIARKGDADMVMVHSKSQEMEFINQGYGEGRNIFACNHFAIVGPKSNPAHIKGYDLPEIMQAIAKSKSTFISRGDKSGTNTKELSLWKEAGIQPNGSWYLESGTGMGATLMMANEKKAYTLTDKATFWTYEGKDRLPNLTILVDGGKSLLNVYSAIAVNPNKVKGVNYSLAVRFIQFMKDMDTQKIIRNFGKDDYGQPLFIPKILMRKDQLQ